MRNQSSAGLERKSDAENIVHYMEMRRAGLSCAPDAVIHPGKGTDVADPGIEYRSIYTERKYFYTGRIFQFHVEWRQYREKRNIKEAKPMAEGVIINEVSCPKCGGHSFVEGSVEDGLYVCSDCFNKLKTERGELIDDEATLVFCKECKKIYPN